MLELRLIFTALYVAEQRGLTVAWAEEGVYVGDEIFTANLQELYLWAREYLIEFEEEEEDDEDC